MRVMDSLGIGSPSDLTEPECWSCAAMRLAFPAISTAIGGPMLSAMNAFLMNAIFYLLRTGCPGRYLPTGSFRRARRSTTFREGVSEATWEELRAALRERGSEPQRRRCRRPIAQVGGKGGSAKGEADAVGYDAGKKVKGRKIHALVDAGGLRLRIVVHSAPIQDRRPGLDRIRQCFNWRTLGRWRHDARQVERAAGCSRRCTWR